VRRGSSPAALASFEGEGLRGCGGILRMRLASSSQRRAVSAFAELLVWFTGSGASRRSSSAFLRLVRGLVVIAFPQGTVHEAGEDLEAAVRSNPKVLLLWESLTPLGRNEFICWVDDAKQPMTRQRRIERTCAELLEGKKRPCCWAGCIHRTDKAPSRWQKAVLIDQKGNKGS